MDATVERVADAIVGWAKHRVSQIRGVPLLPLRFDLGNRVLAEAVRDRLEPQSSAKGWFRVRQSPDADAVRLRNGRPDEVPAGVTATTPLLYLVFWLPGEPRHELNAQSLSDLPSVRIAHLLDDREHFTFPVEHEMALRCREAAEAWPAKWRVDAEASLLGAWNAVRGAIRTGSAGRGGAIAFVERLEDYARFLDRATPAVADWATVPVAERAARLVAKWGEAIPVLGMFTLPALAAVVGIPVRPDQKPGRAKHQESWESVLVRVLGENREAEMDHASLADTIAGKLSVEKQIAALAARIRLSQSDPMGAREALLSFCHTGDPSARERVEWLFFEKPDDRRSAQHGLRGLLLGRNIRKPPVDPVERAVAETREALGPGLGESRAEAMIAWTERLRPTTEEPERADQASLALRALLEGQLPIEPTPTLAEREALQGALTSGSLDAKRLERAIGLWDDLAATTRRPGAEAAAPTLLLGLARLCEKRLGTATNGRCFPEQREPAPGDELVIRYLASRGTDSLEHAWPVSDWSEARMAALGRWLREKVVPAYYGEGDDDDDVESDEETETPPLTLELFRRSGTTVYPLGTIELNVDSESIAVTDLTAQHLACWKESIRPGVNATRRRQSLLFGGNPQVETTSSGLNVGWNHWTDALGKANAGWALSHLIAPVETSAVEWVDTWAAELERVRAGAAGADGAARRRSLEEALSAAVDADDFPMVKSIQKELKALATDGSSAEVPQIESVRGLLRVCTGRRERDGLVEQVVLLPHHPLVLRLRRLADEKLRQVLESMWTTGWPEAGLGQLREALLDWGLPEPLHFYGFWDPEPLVFERWIGESGLAAFGRLSAARSRHGEGLGLGEVTRTVDRYLRLHRAAGDRLRLRFVGDTEGRWALSAIEELIDARKSGFRADVSISGVDEQLDDEILRVQLGAEERSRALEMADDGAPPRVRVRREERDAGSPVHLAIVLGDALPEFRPQFDRQKPPSIERKTWDTGVLFAEPVPRPSLNAFVVQDPPDELSVMAASIIGYARNGQLSVHVERYSFDETVVGAPLQKLHKGAHWLVLVSRQPIYRAVQAAGEQVASLLDFRMFAERNRPVHTSVSVGAGQFQSDLARLDGMLRVLLGTSVPGLGEAVVRAARRFVPGVAINAIGGTNAVHLEGLLGLLLTRREIEAADRLTLSVDQHQDLLSRRAGPIGDVLLLHWTAGSLSASVAESKFTRSVASADSPVSIGAASQVKATLEKLGHLSAAHPLSFVGRLVLARAITAQIQLAADPATTARLEPFLRVALDPGCALHVEPPARCGIHLWSVAQGTLDDAVEELGEVPVYTHGRRTTLEKLAALASEC